jgi:sugar phosphate isomerase/epimerase
MAGPRRDGDVAPLVVVARRWADAIDPPAVLAVRALAARGGRPVLVEAVGRPQRPDRQARREVRTSYAEDDGALRRARDLAWLAARRPAAVLGDLLVGRAAGAPPLGDLAPMARRIREAGPATTVVTLLDPALAERVGALAGRPVREAPRLAPLARRPPSVPLRPVP